VQYGEADPNVVPPPTFVIGTLYIQQELSEFGHENIALWIYTGVSTVGWLNLTDLNKLEVPGEVYLDYEQTYNFPVLKKGHSKVIRIVPQQGEPEQENGFVWLGGLSGIKLGNGSAIIALKDTSGGNWDVANADFWIVNTYNETVVNSKTTKKKTFTYTPPNNTFDLSEEDLDEILIVVTEGATLNDEGTQFTVDDDEVTVNTNWLAEGKKVSIIYNING